MADMAAFVERLGFIGARVPGTGLAGGGLAAAAAPPGASVLPFPRRDSAGSVPEAAAAAPPPALRGFRHSRKNSPFGAWVPPGAPPAPAQPLAAASEGAAPPPPSASAVRGAPAGPGPAASG